MAKSKGRKAKGDDKEQATGETPGATATHGGKVEGLTDSLLDAASTTAAGAQTSPTNYEDTETEPKPTAGTKTTGLPNDFNSNIQTFVVPTPEAVDETVLVRNEEKPNKDDTIRCVTDDPEERFYKTWALP